MARTKIFVSYSSDDKTWKDLFLRQAAVLKRQGLVEIWTDDQIQWGAQWEQEIEAALGTAKIAVLLISSSFMNSDFIWEREMPRIVAHSAQGMRVLPLIVARCAWRLAPELAGLQARPKGGRVLSEGSITRINADLSDLAYELAQIIGKSPVGAAQDVESDIESNQAARISSPDLEGEWQGHYNRNRPIRLTIIQKSEDIFAGRMEYTNEGTITMIEGKIHRHWSVDDPVWAQIDAEEGDDSKLAIIFRETGYAREGSTSINFAGKYFSIITGNVMSGAWFDKTRLVGTFALRRTSAESKAAGI